MDPVKAKIAISETQEQLDTVLICIDGVWREADRVPASIGAAWKEQDLEPNYATLQIIGTH